MTYERWVEEQAKKIHSDGCTLVADFKIYCCWEHDLGYHYGRDPRSAYTLFSAGWLDWQAWIDAKKIERATVDGRFHDCIQKHSWFGRFSPLAHIRWLGVRIFGKRLWDKARAEDSKRVKPAVV